MAYTPATLSALLRDLSVSSDVPKHTEILKHANNVLKTNKSHSEALHTKVVALLHLDRFDDVVKTLTQTPLEQAKFELAYALYKSGKWEAAEEVAREAQKVREVREKVRRGLAHVEAQAVRFITSILFYSISWRSTRRGRGGEGRGEKNMLVSFGVADSERGIRDWNK